MKERTFKVKIEDKETEFKVVAPTVEHKKSANGVRNTIFRERLEAGDILRLKLNDHLRKQKLWDDEKQVQYDTLFNQIRDAERKLLQGAKHLKTVDEAATLAFDIKKWRQEMQQLLTPRNSIDNITVDAQADDAYFNYLVSVCTVYNNGKPYFKNYNDYLSKSGDEVAQKAAVTFAEMFYGLNEDYENDLTENKFLKKWKYIDEKGRRINKDGKLIDDDGNLINEEGYYINADGHKIDKDGNLVDDNGNWIVDYVPFEGETVEEKVEAEVKVEEVEK